MLVLSRKIGESFTVGEDTIIKIERIKGKNVRVSIEAPKHVKILRSELTQHELPLAKHMGKK